MAPPPLLTLWCLCPPLSPSSSRLRAHPPTPTPWPLPCPPLVPVFSATLAAAACTMSAWCCSSSTTPTSGTMMCGCTCLPACWAAVAASKMARAWAGGEGQGSSVKGSGVGDKG